MEKTMKKIIRINACQVITYENVDFTLLFEMVSTWPDGGIDKIIREVSDAGLMSILLTLFNKVEGMKNGS